jgi:membrane protein implicated in regulation of membrane protease activity
MATTLGRQTSLDSTVDGVSAALVGGGIVTMALFPLALPIIALTLVALLPLVVIGLALGLIAAVIVLPVLLIRHLVRQFPSRRPKAAPRDRRRLHRGDLSPRSAMQR